MNVNKHCYFKYHLFSVISAVVVLALQIASQRYGFALLWFGLFFSVLIIKIRADLSPDKYEYKPAPIRNRLSYPIADIKEVHFVNNQIQVFGNVYEISS